MRLAAALAVVLALAGCATTPEGPPPTPTAAPDLRGGWTGTWGGAPLTLTVTDQVDDAPYSGLYVGPWLVSGQRVPGMSGILTYQRRPGEPVSVAFNGWFVARTPMDLRVLASAPDGLQKLKLTLDGPDHLVGTGDSDNHFGPQGPVELTRTDKRP